MLDEKFHLIFKDFKKGKSSNYIFIINFCLYIIVDELSKKESYKDEMVEAYFLLLLKAIDQFSYEKSSDLEIFIRNYINFGYDKIVENGACIDEININYIYINKLQIQQFIEKIRAKLTEIDIKNKKKLTKTKKM